MTQGIILFDQVQYDKLIYTFDERGESTNNLQYSNIMFRIHIEEKQSTF